MLPNGWRSDAPMSTVDENRGGEREIDRALKSRRQHEQEEDAKMERRIRLAMAAKSDSQGNCFYCGAKLDVERSEENGRIEEIFLHPMPYLACKGPPVVNPVRMALIRQAAGLPKLPEIKPVRRPAFGIRDDD